MTLSTAAPRAVSAADVARAGALVLVAGSLGAGVSVQPALALAGALGLLAAAAVAARPVAGVYALLVLTPLTAGIDRGTLVPVLRPNEALCAVVALGIGARWLVSLTSVREMRLRPDPLLGAMLALAAAGSIVPLLWLGVRGLPVTADDVLYALLLWKFVLVFVVVRAARLTAPQVQRALVFSVATAALIGMISLLQTAGWGPIIDLLTRYYTNNDNAGAITGARGSSTLGLPIAVADLLTFNLAIVLGAIWLRRRSTPLLVAASWILTLGVIGAGEFSGVIGLLIGVVTVCVTVRAFFPARLLALGVVAATPFVWTVIETRLAGFQSLTGLPVSWTGRLDNLRTYFWPVLFSDHRYVLGVQPAARVVAPHRANGFIWIESGYTWLLWAGGIPMLLAFGWFVVVAARTGLQAFRSTSDPHRLAGLACLVAVVVITVLMVFDPHLTYRGVADELFALLALSVGAPRPDRSHATDRVKECRNE